MSGVQIKNYGMFYKNEDSPVHKKNKKKLSKRHILRTSNFDFMKYQDKSNLLQTLIKYLQTIRKQHLPHVGIIFDTNIIIHDITYIPELPSKFDILCLESQLQSYKKTSEKSLYWTPTDIISSGNFIINGGSIDKIIQLAKLCKTLDDFFPKLNELYVFTITQNHFSEREENHIHDPLVINKKLTEQDIIAYDTKLSNEFYTKFQSLSISSNKLQTYSIKDELLPKISLICPFTDKSKFFHTLLTFLRLDYPKHLLELVIVDDSKSENEMNLPEDSRIRLININNSQDPGQSLPLGYKLNMGVKHASHNLIMHFFDTNNYSLDLRNLVSHFILSNKECVVSKDTGLYSHTKESSIINIPDLSNCLYTKDFWKKCSFEELNHKLFINCDLIYKWLNCRINEISFLPFIYMSFKIKKYNDNVLIQTDKCHIDLSLLVDKKIKESLDLLF
jgi:hypothetical protein